MLTNDDKIGALKRTIKTLAQRPCTEKEKLDLAILEAIIVDLGGSVRRTPWRGTEDVS